MFLRIKKRPASSEDAITTIHFYSLSGEDYIVRCPHCHRLTNLFNGNIFGRKFRHAIPGYSDIGCGGVFKVSRGAKYSAL
jgi:glutaredoxin